MIEENKRTPARTYIEMYYEHKSMLKGLSINVTQLLHNCYFYLIAHPERVEELITFRMHIAATAARSNAKFIFSNTFLLMEVMHVNFWIHENDTISVELSPNYSCPELDEDDPAPPKNSPIYVPKHVSHRNKRRDKNYSNPKEGKYHKW